MRNLRIIILVLVLLLVAGCSSPAEEEATPTPQPTLEILTINVTAEVLPLLPAVEACNDEVNAHVIVNQVGNKDVSEGHDLLITLDHIPEAYLQSVQIAEEALVVVTTSAVTANLTLPTESLESIYTGRVGSWSEVPGGRIIGNEPIGVWNYPEGHPLREIFEGAVFPTKQEATSGATIAPNPEQMAEGLSGSPNQIGYLPAAWLKENLPVIDVEDWPEFLAQLPVIVASKATITGEAQAFIACLQSGTGQKILEDVYSNSER